MGREIYELLFVGFRGSRKNCRRCSQGFPDLLTLDDGLTKRSEKCCTQNVLGDRRGNARGP